MATPHDDAITVHTLARYNPSQSEPEKERYTFSYQITIHNGDDDQVQLLSRYWLITDANGKKIEIQGDGVVGKQPLIPAGEQFQYTSGVVLDTPVGVMQGHYVMCNASGEEFQVPIAPFRLALPNIVH